MAGKFDKKSGIFSTKGGKMLFLCESFWRKKQEGGAGPGHGFAMKCYCLAAGLASVGKCLTTSSLCVAAVWQGKTACIALQNGLH